MYLYPEVSDVASVAIVTLNQIGITACFVGGMACKLYGNDRIPGVRPATLRHTRRGGVLLRLCKRPRLLRSLQGHRYPVPQVFMGSGGAKAPSRRS